jgi:predicted N-formylglutamate amidohydrolase
MAGNARPWQIGVLHDGGDARFAHALLDELRRDPTLTVGDNEPYRMDEIDYTIPRHAYPAGCGYAEIEIRQDLLATDEQIDGWAALLDRALHAALAAVSPRAGQSSVSATTSNA